MRQINQKADVIKENMKDAWEKLEELEQTYAHMLTKTYRLQSNRICLEVLAGEPEEGHPEMVSRKLFFCCSRRTSWKKTISQNLQLRGKVANFHLTIFNNSSCFSPS